MNSARWRAILEVAGFAGTPADGSARLLAVRSPIDGAALAYLPIAGAGDVNAAIAAARAAFEPWRAVPAPRRGELVRQFAQRVRQHQQALADLITLEAGKIPAEAKGEVQEVIDICDFACGMSRQLQGLTLPSERPGHHLLERWHPLGPVAIITAFNFPMAVWAWNAALALICGDSILWKPSEKTPLCAQALHRLLEQSLAEFPEAPAHLSQLVIGTGAAGAQLAADARVALVSATGSTAMGRKVAQAVAMRFGRSLLELGGNNAAIVTPSADLAQALRAIVFAATGTAGQRCTTLRRLYVQRGHCEDLATRLLHSLQSIPVGNPFEAGTLLGPLIDRAACEHMQAALAAARAAGAAVHGGERVAIAGCATGYYVRPALVRLTQPIPVMWQETFAPILYVQSYDELGEAIKAQNAATHGLSSAIFTNDVREAELFLSALGSDCGLANVNCGTSGAEVGAAFGGEKDSGGGRESGSDVWKSYMRRQTQTVNYSGDLLLAQGVQFG
jgi:aldehyde dehydrogenase (NAD+)